MFLRRSFATFAVALLAGGAPIAAAGPAVAEPGSGTLSSTDGVIYATGCVDQPVQFNLALPAGTTNWSLEISTVAPNGTPGPAQRASSPGGTPNSAVALSFCYFHEGGDYTLNGVLTVRQGFPNPEFVTVLTPITFTMRQARSETTLRAKTERPRSGRAVKFFTASRQEEPTGYAGTNAEVVLQTKRKGRWVTLERTRTATNSAGRAKFAAKTPKGAKKVKFRAMTVSGSHYGESTSKTITIRPKR